MNNLNKNERKEVILGTLRNLDSASIRPFFESLKSTGYSGDIVMFCNSLTKETLQYLREQGVKTIPFNYWAIRNHQPMLLIWWLWKRVIALLPTFEAKAFVARRVWFLFYLRFLMYYEFLLKNPEYIRIMITDVRDVWFQNKPFDWMGKQSGLFCFEEQEGITIGQCPSNKQMIYESVGSKKAMLMENCQISCAGVTIGTRNEMLIYLKKFCEVAFKAYAPKTSTGSDQGIHNWIIYQELLPGIKILNNAGPVYTMGLFKDDDITLNAKGEVINSSGTSSIPAILHQYDRFTKVTNILMENLKVR